jgi:hypothetical protein
MNELASGGREKIMRRLGLFVVLGAPLLVVSAGDSAPAPRLSSTAVSWEEIQAKPSPNGRARQVFQAPTATLDELELHVTTLPAGESSHPPHKHGDGPAVYHVIRWTSPGSSSPQPAR